MIIGTQSVEISVDNYANNLGHTSRDVILKNYTDVKDGLYALYRNGLITLDAMEDLEYPLLYFTMEALHKEAGK